MIKNLLLKTFFSLVFIAFFSLGSFGQDISWYKSETPKSTYLVGGGVTFLGFTAKAGVFLNKNFVVGINGEIHRLLSDRNEVGVFGRKYINKNRLSFYVQPGLSYGSFTEWDLGDIHEPNPVKNTKYNTFKINGTGGAELRINQKISVEGDVGVGKILDGGWWAPSIRCSFNVRI